jgi:hypothetical protein
MPAPPSAMAHDEQLLDSDQLNQLDCLNVERKKIVIGHGGILDSEKVSRSETYGYIFRYNVERPCVDEIIGPYTARSTLVLYTKDCKTFSGATYPITGVSWLDSA